MGCIIDIKVVPRSGKQVCKLKGQHVVCYLKSAPERGQANKELIKMLAKAAKIPQQDIEIIGGKTSRNKRIKIARISKEVLYECLGIMQQMHMFDTAYDG